MTYQERKTISLMLASVLLTFGYAWYVYKFKIADIPIVDLPLSFWAKTTLWMLPVAIIGRIVFIVLFMILNTIITRETDTEVEDERDKLIELKSDRISNYFFMSGFFVAMWALAFDYPGYLLFIIIFLFGFIGEQFSYIMRLKYYRKGF
ncbi:MAG: DUF2178 domain-containing protein [Bacteroidia bacterium]